MSKARRILRTVAAFVLAVALLELGAYGVRRVLIPPKWSVDKHNRMPRGFDGVIDYADIVKGRGAQLGWLTVNRFGLRGPEPKADNTRRPGRLRVYCLGSSTTFGWGATNDSTTYPAQLQQYLQALMPDTAVEVINGGIPGNSSRGDLGILREDVPRFTPDVVVLWSGWPDWGHYLQSETPGKRAIGFAYIAQAAATVSAGIQGQIEKTSIYRDVTYVRDAVTPRADPPSDEELARRPGVEAFHPESLTFFSANLTAMIDVCKKEGATPIVLGLPTPLRHPPNELSALARRQGASRLFPFEFASRDDLYRSILDVEKTIATIAQTAGVQYTGAAQLPDGPELFIDGIHLNDAGYSELAKTLAPIVKSVAEQHEEK